MTLFEEFRGFDISDRIQAAKVTRENAQILADVVEGQLNWIESDIQKSPIIVLGEGLTAAGVGDYIVKMSTGKHEVVSKTEFEKTFARNS